MGGRSRLLWEIGQITGVPCRDVPELREYHPELAAAFPVDRVVQASSTSCIAPQLHHDESGSYTARPARSILDL